MLSDEQLLSVYADGELAGRPFLRHEDGLRAVEAAVRADQIEKDKAIAYKKAGFEPINSDDERDWTTWTTGRAVGDAIHAQLPAALGVPVGTEQEEEPAGLVGSKEYRSSPRKSGATERRATEAERRTPPSMPSPAGSTPPIPSTAAVPGGESNDG